MNSATVSGDGARAAGGPCLPRTLLVSWQRPDGRYAGAEVLRKIVGELPRGQLRWACLAHGAAASAGMPEHRGFEPRALGWRLRNRALSYWFVHTLQARRLARRIAEWARPFAPEVVWTVAELGAVNVTYHLSRMLGAPVHATVHDAYDFARLAMPPAYYRLYRRDVARLMARVRSMDAVSQPLLDGIRSGFNTASLSETMVFRPSILRSHMTDPARGARADSRRIIGLCGSMRTRAGQWEEFLRLLGKLPFQFTLLVFVDREAFFAAAPPANVAMEFQDYVPTEADVVRRFRSAPADACYLGLSDLPEHGAFAAHSLSSKLTTYAAAACPAIVHGPADSVAWDLVSRYGAGVRLGSDEGSAVRELERLFGDAGARQRACEGAARLCREEFDLERNVAAFAALLGRTAGAGGAR